MIRIVTPPAVLPATLAEVREWCRISSTDTSQDGTLTILIGAATAYAEHVTGRAFVERTLELSSDYFHGCVEFPQAPLLGVESVKYTDLDGNEQTVSPSSYEVDTASEPGRLRALQGFSWSSVGRYFNPVRYRFYAGYRPVGSPVDLTDNSYLPMPFRQWLNARVCTLYDNRDQIAIGATVMGLPRDFVDGLLDPLILGTRLF